MTEIAVHQRSAEWFDLRRSVLLTASNFGDAIGVGVGKPFDFLQSLVNMDDNGNFSETEYTKHGTCTEPIIDEAYQLLTGHRTWQSGFWMPAEGDPLYGLVGASPDAKVVDEQGVCVGLAEYKAPVYCLYSEKTHGPHAIPRRYMAQMQGQMAISRKSWCDFMAVCTKTKDITLKRVHFHLPYWTTVSHILHEFCSILKEARDRHGKGTDPFNFKAAQTLRAKCPTQTLFPGESTIPVEDLLVKRGPEQFRCEMGRRWMTYGFLMGLPV